MCDFCKKKESELYQKEVGEMALESLGLRLYLDVMPSSGPGCSILIIVRSVSVCLLPDLPPEHTRGAFLSPVDSVPALSGLPP